MNSFKSLVQMVTGDYLQRTRSYAFLITMAISLAVAYSFVPADKDSYSTLTLVGFKGIYNLAWAASVSALMTSIFLSLTGFFLVNSSIKKDIDTRVGLIIATCRVSNFKYLLSKFLGNLLVLFTIIIAVILVVVLIYFYRNTNYPFNIVTFILPFFLVTAPAIVFVSALAVIAEVLFGKRLFIQYICYFVLFNSLVAAVQLSSFSYIELLDPLGIKMITKSIEAFVDLKFHKHIQGVSVGYIFSEKKAAQLFLWPGVHWSVNYLISRVCWIFISVAGVFMSSLLFKRFDEKPKDRVFQSAHIGTDSSIAKYAVDLKHMPVAEKIYSIIPLIKTELLLLTRKPKLFLIVVITLWLSLFLSPLYFAHAYILPVLLFAQVIIWSDLTSKEKTSRVHYFTWSSYRPVGRLLTAQILANITWAVSLSFPLIIRYLFAGNFTIALAILIGSIFIVLVAMLLGMLTGGKKTFEILYFLLTYALLQKITAADYLGVFHKQSDPAYIGLLFSVSIVAVCLIYLIREVEIKKA